LASGLFAFEGEAGLDHHLVMAHLAVLDVPAGLDDLEPAQIPQGLVRPLDCGLNRILDALLRRADEFDDLVDMVIHGALHLRRRPI